ncbi:MAG: esterase [Actinophytocola sp.]|uniref:alpha/beta hydrolase n=1 Tax=Actinophytocola sp. TaxID=1872138 RepID=UPI00132578DB|nr:alpha/beta hydrolase-fold protein [Actinophytocola sp.]MPZ79207.1 esterase [Actinophytocola sp.]
MRRRTLLRGASGLGLAGLAGCSSPAPPLPPPTVTGSKPNRPVNVEYVRSEARGRNVTLVVMRPAGEVDSTLPVCVALHGRGSDARMFVQLGVPDLLTQLAGEGRPPFAMVGVDGGNDYWVARTHHDDPQRMLTEELPGWLAERDLEPAPFAAFGLSMGGYGALNYARTTPHPVVAALSPALFLDWPDAESRDAFAGEEAWASTDPFQHLDALGDTKLGVWCGTDDPFVDAARKLADAASPEVAAFDPGDHDAPYWLRTVPRAVRFLADHAG